MAKINLTTGKISAFTCGAANQAFLWDATVPGLGVRATPGGKKTFILESRFAGKTIRLTIGDVGGITLDDARSEARRLLLLIGQGVDPREQKRQVIAEQVAATAAREKEEAHEQVKTATVRTAWDEYIEDRKQGRGERRWGERHYRDHMNMAQQPGRAYTRGKGVLVAGPLHAVLNVQFADLTPVLVETWLRKQAAERPTQGALALRMLKAFLNWCADHDRYKAALQPGLVTKKTASLLPRVKARSDALQMEQLAPWFAAVRQIGNPVIAAYLQTLLLTGARREELTELKWECVDFRWKSLTIRDKVEGERIIPLTPYVEQLLRFLPKRNQWVFSSPTAASGRIREPRIAHNRAMQIAGIEDLTLHGLRRSFGTLAEWVELPIGIVAQIMGHKPSAIAEKHYRVRPLDLLRRWHTLLETWILEQAGIAAPVERAHDVKLKAVAGGKR